MGERSLCVEDICIVRSFLPDQTLWDKKCMVDRTVTDVHSHMPHPQHDYTKPIERHEDIPKKDFNRFLKTGRPPSGTALVTWIETQIPELLPTRDLKLIHRWINPGDAVKLNAKGAMSGVVVGKEVRYSLRWAQSANWTPPSNELHSWLEKDGSGRLRDMEMIPAEDLMPAVKYGAGDWVVYRDWLGVIEETQDDITVLLSNGALVTVFDSSGIVRQDAAVDRRIQPGELVSVGDTNLRRGNFIYGVWEPTAGNECRVMDVKTTDITVGWRCMRMGSPSKWEPPQKLDKVDLNSGEVHVYDQGRQPFHASMKLARNICDEDRLGQRVRFRDFESAFKKFNGQALKCFDGTTITNRMYRPLKPPGCAFDTAVYTITEVAARVTVRWQDLSETTHLTTELSPDHEYEDDNEVWPGEIVVSRVERNANEGMWKPSRIGVVQSVIASERIARVLWQENVDVEYVVDISKGKSYLKGMENGGFPIKPQPEGRGVLEDTSLYDIAVAPDLSSRYLDIVMLVKQSKGQSPAESAEDEIDWVGQVVDQRLDGMLVVRFGALKQAKEELVPPDAVVFAGPGTTLDEDWAQQNDGNGDWEGSEFSFSDRSSPAPPIEVWYENEQGERLNPSPAADDSNWSTEGSVEEQMPDAAPGAGAVDASGDTHMPLAGAFDYYEAAGEPSPSTEPPAESKEATVNGTGAHEESPKQSTEPPRFEILDSDVPDDHFYLQYGKPSTQKLRRIHTEHGILSSSLPEGIYVRSWESRLDLLRVLIVGPTGTPYEYAPFIIDISLGHDFPQQPPHAFFHSWTYGHGVVNPNLYENGKICLSLLNTWQGEKKSEAWNPNKSTLLQVLVSIVGLVLVKEPYYNEAGYEVLAGSEEAKVPSEHYSERVYFRTRSFMTHAMGTGVKPFVEVLQWLYIRKDGAGAPVTLLIKAIDALREIVKDDGRGDVPLGGGLARVSKGALIMCKRQLQSLEGLQAQLDKAAIEGQEAAVEGWEAKLDEMDVAPSGRE